MHARHLGAHPLPWSPRLVQVRKKGFAPALPPELDLVETEDQITHEVHLDDALDPQVGGLGCGEVAWGVRWRREVDWR
jgi:hypothetical protein